MLNIRQSRIRAFIEEKRVVTMKELQALCPEVSLMTIHRDLDTLAQLGAVVKIRGGARAVLQSGDPVFEIRLQENNAQKAQIARKALTLLQPNGAVFLDASTTNLVLARNMPDIPLNVFTTGPNIALELCRLNNPVVTLCCGTINRKNMALSGKNTLEMLEKINIDLAFIGVSGCSAESGFTCGTESDMLVKELVIQKARTSVILCDSSKFSRLMPYTFASFADVDYLITDGPAPERIIQACAESGVHIL